MKQTLAAVLLGLAALSALGSQAPRAAAEDAPGARDFSLRDVDGKTHRLSAYRGKWVLLEWTNVDSPAVKTLYQARSVRSLQDAYRPRGLVWLTVEAAIDSKRSPAETKQAVANLGGHPNAVLLDPRGSAGRSFGVQVTPEVRLISPKGRLVYSGAITGPRGEAYLATVMQAVAAGKPVPYASQVAHGSRIAYTNAPAATSPSFRGPKAPNFALVDSGGVTRRLSDYRGRWVVLEWVNYDCPFVKAQYRSPWRSMQKLQARCAQQGIVWLSICSSARGKQGSLSSGQANARIKAMGATPSAYLHDLTGAVGRSYGAKKTPDMRLISPQGTIEYSGGIGTPLGVRKAGAKNYLALALADVAAGRPVAVKHTKPEGCSVKY